MKYEFLATSSSGMDLYVVTVSDDIGKLEIRCNCAAGQRDVLCRHRIALITNKPRGVYAIAVPCRYTEKFVDPKGVSRFLDIPPNRANGAVPVITGALRL